MTLSGYIFIAVVLVLVVCLDAWIISSIARSDNPQRLKVAWSAAVIFLPLLGWALWGRFGSRGMAYPPSASRGDAENAIHEAPSSAGKPTQGKASYQELP